MGQHIGGQPSLGAAPLGGRSSRTRALLFTVVYFS